jgi:iron complex outermembrane recepter protein
VTCRVKSFINVDVSGRYSINDNFTLYFNVLNALNAKAPYDPSTYGAYQYNPAWSSSGVIGRYFRAGVRVTY